MDIMAYTSTTPEHPAVAPVKRMSFDRAIRKIFPSTSKLTFNPLFKATVNACLLYTSDAADE